ncbi:related to heterokaryon incompatibility protein [Fusarium mangiferae]|uniref:Related to heterokaryon incompatibility protein n=1 Tax=Fusarium mangiferae TaxID=192010 RepID=A0A1L7U6B0_FUSMA|nr:uncharacterized protein FMAN_00149 [Fusarium mangiferae]CVL02646.1 related to heterokaryon incompatibility protein [Fusarium mangiferae]
MNTPRSKNYHIAIVAPLPEDYKTARALLDEPSPEYHLKSSGAACSLGKVGPHNVVLVGKAENMTNVSIFVKDTVDNLLEAYSSIRAGFLIGVDATAPEDSLAKPGDIVVGFPQGRQPGLIQFNADETITSNHISTTFETSHPPSSVKSVINSLKSTQGRQQWSKYLQDHSPRAELGSTKDHQRLKQGLREPTKVLCGKVASSDSLLYDRDLANKVGSDNKIMCFERAAACIKSRFPFLTVCGTVSSISSSSRSLNESAIRRLRMTTVICTMFISHRISTAQLEVEHAFTYRFQYNPFDLESAGFRLALLEKGSQSQIRCRLVQVYLNDIIPYEAVSYSWESQSTPHEIMVDEKTLSITESLHDALRHLRRPDEDRMLWIDALCIDQTNIKERGHQVNRMGEIYKKADRVIVWLGYLSGNATQLKSAITMLEAQVAKLPGIPRKWPREDPRWKSQWRQVEANFGPLCRDKLVDGLKSFMQKPWFSRVWILQEVANAKRTIVTCNLGEVPGWIFALLPHAMDVEVDEQCKAVLDIMPHPSTPSTSRKETRNLSSLLWKFRGCKATDPRDRVYALLGMATDMKGSHIQPDYAKEEHVVMKDLYAYIIGGEWPAHDSPASNIQDLQQKLPAISKQRLQQVLRSTFRTDLLEHFLCRQSLISMIKDGDLFYVMQHGSRAMQAFLDKSAPLPDISLDVGLECLQRFPDVFEVLLRRPDCTFQDMPRFVARAIEYRPQIFERLVKSYSDPEKLRHDVLLQVIPRGLPMCQALFDNCESPIDISKEMLLTAIHIHRDIVQILLEEARSPIEVFENIFLEATPGGLHILDESRKPIMITKELIGKSIVAGPGALQLVLATMESTIELDEDLFITSIKNGLGTLKRLLTVCIKPFNVTKRVYGQAIEAGDEILSYLFPKSSSKLTMTESYVASCIIRPHDYDVEKKPWHVLRSLCGYGEGKLQITDKLMSLAKDKRYGFLYEMMYWIRRQEKDVSDEVAISAIRRGPKAFMALLNEEGTNFRVTKQILEVAIEHSYAFEALGLRRHSEVFTDSLNLDQCVLPGMQPPETAQKNEV